MTTHSTPDLSFYTVQSRFSNPRIFEHQYENLPSLVSELCEITQGLLIHELDGPLFGVFHSPARLYERNLRTIDKMLERIFELDNSPLQYVREPKKKLIATCRDFALILVSMLRNLEIPARLRVGFATYIYSSNPDACGDHIIAEYWDGKKGRWVLVDPMISACHIEKKIFSVDFDIYDVPNTRFINAGKVWSDCRNGLRDQNHYGVFYKDIEFKGMWYIRNRLMQDFAALNKWEMLIWDAWGYMLCDGAYINPTDPEQLETLDRLAIVVTKNEISLEDIIESWSNQNLSVPSVVMSYDRYNGATSVDVINY